ncbi:MAG: NlpC/P60 family protein [Candidatus Marinimicrobia bacterium]|nr:NlpC/P60 family protein [Candidatus Neomarinimicrobiota bacterium]
MKKIIKTPFANMYEEARFSSQLVTQGIMWEIAEVLDQKGDWIHLRTPDGYEAWAQNFSTLDMTDEMERMIASMQKIMIHTPFLSIYDNSKMTGQRKAVAAMGASFPYLKKQDDVYEVLMPDASIGYIEQKSLSITNPRDIILCSAGKLLGCSYFWGGKTENGCDCSGITQMCFIIAGIQLPRDASQQIKVLKEHPVDIKEAKPGDLAFFQNEKGNIIHVAIMRRSPEFIHSSGEVKLNSFDPEAAHYSEKLHKMLEGIYSIDHIL